MSRLSRLYVLPVVAFAAFALGGCEVFFLMGEEDFEKHPEVRRTSELFMDADELQASRAKRAHAKALLAANPRWSDYREACEDKDWKKAAALAATFDLKPLTDGELGGVEYALEQAGAPAEKRAAVADARRALVLRWDRWPEFMAACRAEAWEKAADAAQSFSEINALGRVRPDEWRLIETAAAKANRPRLAGLRERALAFEERVSRERAAKERAEYAADQARVAKSEAHRAASPAATPGRAFDFQGTLENNGGAREQRRCAACLGSGKANYIGGGKVAELDVNGKPTGRTSDPVCTRCNGTGYHD